ncbi:S1 family peptidase [Taibaiella soli]|uniref:Serine protease n=1 Tax=Taibaiella soli TaxID=1649169 RepID=A0A2W2AK43_9BACT|nr:serine protease [Taibaiella soli]PZF72620.1 hypothetical protein DN068_12195 [Taibaiella soli]
MHRRLAYQILLILFISITRVCAADENYARSVVKVMAFYGKDKQGKDLCGLSTGFVYNQANTVVTTLHSIAGANSIIVRSEITGIMFRAKPLKVLKNADLVLLQLNTDSRLPALHSANVSSNSHETFRIWGYPLDVATMQGDNITFLSSLNNAPVLNEIIGTSTYQNLIKEINAEGYPALNTQIERVSAIQPGHSGSPIFNSLGQVIGIADGGIAGGYARINWAIKAEPYLNDLLASNQNVTGISKSSLNELYSMELTNKPDDVFTPNIVIRDRYNQKMVKTWVKSLAELINSLPTNEDDARNAFKHYQNDYKLDIEDIQIQVYENFETGFTLAVPVGSKFYLDDKSGYFVIESDYEKEYYLMNTSKNFDSLVNRADAFDKYFELLDDWILPAGAYSEYTKKEDYYRIGRDLRSSDNKVLLNVRADVYHNFLDARATIRDSKLRNGANPNTSYVLDVLDRINKSNLPKLIQQ